MQLTNYTPKSSKDLIDHLITTKKTEDTVFIIGGGPSLKTVLPNPRILDTHDVICTNNAYKLYPDAMLLHFADKVWWNWHQEPEHDVKSNFNGIITSATKSKAHHLHRDETRVWCFKNGDKKGGLSRDFDKLNGNNTGHQAINIATHMEYEQIVLIGFDLNPAKTTHWHNDHKRMTNVDNFAKTMIPGFESLRTIQKDFNTQVWNLNENSAIRTFPFANLQDFI